MARKAAKGALNDREARFVVEYLKDLNITRAAKAAGYSKKTAAAQGSRLLKNVDVAAAVQAGQAKRLERVELKGEDILRELLRIATSDLGQAYDENGDLKAIHDIPEDVRRAIAGIEVDVIGTGDKEDGTGTPLGFTKKVKLWDKLRAAELLLKHLGLLKDKVEVEVTASLEELLRLAARRKGSAPPA